MLGDVLFAWRSLQGRAEAGGREGVVRWRWRGWGVRAELRSEAGRSWAGPAVGCRWVLLTQSHVSVGRAVRGVGPPWSEVLVAQDGN